MKTIALLICLMSITIGHLHAQYVFGFASNYFCSYDLQTNEPDTLITFSQDVDDFGFHCAIDRYNGRYFFGGRLPGLVGNFHIICLETFKIESYSLPTAPDNMEYDFAHHQIIYEDRGEFYSIPLDSIRLRHISTVSDVTGIVWGLKRTYVPQTDRYMYATYINSNATLLVIDALTGEVVCDETTNSPSSGYITNQYSGEVMGHRNGRFGFIDICQYSLSQLSQVPGYGAHLNAQMAVFNHIDSTYIIPFAESGPNSTNKLALIDIYDNKIIEVRDHAWDGRMNMQQIYEKPDPPIIYLRDTLFVPKGSQYFWFRDGIRIGRTDVNYWVPDVEGNYFAVVKFKAYIAKSKEMEVSLPTTVSTVDDQDIRVYPNPVTDYLTIENNSSRPHQVWLRDITGKCIWQSTSDQTGSGHIIIQTTGLRPGLYFLTLVSDTGVNTFELAKI